MVGHSDHPGYEKFGLYQLIEELDTSGRLVGVTGNGKSTYILMMIRAALESGIGMSLLDPKGGDLFTELVSVLPTHCLQKTILVDPGDDTHPCPVLNVFDPFAYMEPDDQAETIVRALEYRFPDGFGHNMRPIFVRAALACIAANSKLKVAGLPPKYGLLDVTETGFLEPRLEIGDPKSGDYEQPPVRAEVLSHLRGDARWKEIVRYWDGKDANQSAGQQAKEWNPITNKTAQLKNRNVAKFLSGGHSSFDLMDILQNGKLLLFNLSQGSMAGDAHELLGTLVLNLIMRTAAIRHDRAVRGIGGSDPKKLTRFINVVDEVQNFLCPEMTKILTEGRAMRCSLWVAHQYIHQIRDKDRSMAEAFANAGTTVLFGTTNDDARNVAEFIDDARFTPTVVAGMPKYHFVLQRKDSEPVTGITVEMPDKDQTRIKKVRRWCAAALAFAEASESDQSDVAAQPGYGNPPDGRANTGASPTESSRGAAPKMTDGSEVIIDVVGGRGKRGREGPPDNGTGGGAVDSGAVDSGAVDGGNRVAKPRGGWYGDRKSQHAESAEVRWRIASEGASNPEDDGPRLTKRPSSSETDTPSSSEMEDMPE